MIRKTSVFKEYSIVKDGRRYYYCYAVDMDSFVYDFEVRKLVTYINTNKPEFKECDIVYSSALYPQDGEEIGQLLAKLKGDM